MNECACLSDSRSLSESLEEPGLGPRRLYPHFRAPCTPHAQRLDPAKCFFPSLGTQPPPLSPPVAATRQVRNGWTRTTTPWPTSIPFPPAWVSLWDQEMERNNGSVAKSQGLGNFGLWSFCVFQRWQICTGMGSTR